MRLSILVVASAASILLAGCSSCCSPCNKPCSSPCQSPCKPPAPAPARQPCAMHPAYPSYPAPTPYYASIAPRLTAPSTIAVTPARGSFRLPELGVPVYAPAAPAPRPSTYPPSIAVRSVAPAPAAAVYAPSAPAPMTAMPTRSAAIVAPVPASASKTDACEDCSDGHCGVPPPR